MKHRFFTVRPAFIGFLLPVTFVIFGSTLVRVWSRPDVKETEPLESTYVALSAMQSNLDIVPQDADVLQAAHAAFRRAMELHRGDEDAIENPFYYHVIKVPEPPVEVVEEESAEEEVEEPPPPPPVMRLTGIMRGRSPIAVVNDSIYQVGEYVEEDWKVVYIDTDKQFVVVESSDGRRVTLHPEP